MLWIWMLITPNRGNEIIYTKLYQWTSLKTEGAIEGAIENGHSRETGNIGYTRRRQGQQMHSTER